MEKTENIEAVDTQQAPIVSVDLNDVKKKLTQKVLQEQEEKRVLEEEASYISYLNSVDVETIADKVDRGVIEHILSNEKMPRVEKVSQVKKLVAKSAIASCVHRIDQLGGEELPSDAIEKIKALHKKGENLSEKDLILSDAFLGILQSEFRRIGLKKVSKGLESVVNPANLTGIEKYNYDMLMYINKGIGVC